MAPGRLTVRGEVRLPGDKSISHRALLLSALSDGISRIDGLLDSADVRSTAHVLRALGAAVPRSSPTMTIRGVGLRGLAKPATHLDCGNSGTTARLTAGVVAACRFAATFVGDASLSRRPMRRVARPLTEMGARVEFERDDGLPMTVHGSDLRPIDWVSDTASAQVKSALLLAGSVAGVEVHYREPAPSRDHTERMLAARGVAIEVTGGGLRLRPASRLAALDVNVPSDPSSAAFFAGLATVATSGELRLPGVCVNPTRAAFFDVLRRMGGRVEFESQRDQGGEPVADIIVAPGPLVATSVGGDQIPSLIDEIPLLACLASRALGETRITGAAELRVKESDRITAVVANLQRLGIAAQEQPDGLIVAGSDAPARGRVVTHGDHRLAMAFGVLGAIPGNAIDVDDPHCVAVSFPGFWDELRRVSASQGRGMSFDG